MIHKSDESRRTDSPTFLPKNGLFLKLIMEMPGIYERLAHIAQNMPHGAGNYCLGRGSMHHPPLELTAKYFEIHFFGNQPYSQF
jgi:hypothetical protein